MSSSAPSTDETPAKKAKRAALSVRSRLLLMLLLTSLISIAVVAFIGYQYSRSIITQNVFDELTSLKSSKKIQMEWYFKNLSASFGAFGSDVGVLAAQGQFRSGFLQLGQSGNDPEQAKKLKQLYSSFVAKTIQADGGPTVEASDYMPRTERGKNLQSLFLVQNPNKAGQRDRLVDHPVSNPMTLAHNTYHGWFRDLAHRLELSDVMLIDPDDLQIVYSVSKNVDVGTSLNAGPWAQTELGKLVRDVMQNSRIGETKMSDFSFYAPAGGKPELFIATPIYAKWRPIGVLAASISVDAMNRFMTNDQKWVETGLGESGEVYVVGSDYLMRTDSRFRIQDPAGFAKGLASLDMPAKTIEQVDRHKTSILLNRVETPPITAALRGETDTLLTQDYRGVPVLSSFAPLDIPGLNWVIAAEKDRSEALGSLSDLARTLLIAGCILALLITLAALWFANQFLVPIHRLLDGMKALQSGDRQVAIAEGRQDEFGELSRSFNAVSVEIDGRDTTIENQANAYEGILKRIFPDAVAERLKNGETSFVDSVPNVSVIYITINGLAGLATDDHEKDAFEFQNELLDSFDSIADELGVEKIKTTGEHYIGVCGLSVPRLDHAKRSVEFVSKLLKVFDRVNRQRGIKLSLSCGISSGYVQAGLVGKRRFAYDIWGRTCNIARFIVNNAGFNEIVLSEEMVEALGDGAQFGERFTTVHRELGELHYYRLAMKNDKKDAESAENA